MATFANWWVKSEVLPLFSIGKTLEVRIAWGQAMRVQVGDKLIINQQIERRVRYIRRYSSLEAMLRKEDYRLIHPKVSSEAELLRLMRSIMQPHQKSSAAVIVFELDELTQ